MQKKYKSELNDVYLRLLDIPSPAVYGALVDALFYKEHDYNIVEDKVKGTIILIDPSIDDYLRIGVKPLK